MEGVTTAIKCGILIDGIGQPLKDAVILFERNKIKIKTNNEYINIKTELEKENDIENIKFKLVANYLLEFLKSDFSDEFKTFIDDKKICFRNNDVEFITSLMKV